jgi:hypothetical protein
MDSEQLLAALRDDSEWPAATLLHTYLEPLEEVLKGEPERLGQVWELWRCLHRAGEVLEIRGKEDCRSSLLSMRLLF